MIAKLNNAAVYCLWLGSDTKTINIVEKRKFLNNSNADLPTEVLLEPPLEMLGADLPGGTEGKLYAITSTSPHYALMKFAIQNHMSLAEVNAACKTYGCKIPTLLSAWDLYSKKCTTLKDDDQLSVGAKKLKQWVAGNSSRPLSGNRTEWLAAVKELWTYNFSESIGMNALQHILAVTKQMIKNPMFK